ncbi:hypothetical protein M407DRAFT_27887 [Tulasnella calospora MUT 4182]|uniref:Uncharacterized protein n=1 Tax=Tulasnella calospora MUT 4182 TaxID=1051891 RepID=A0A0C3QBM4_9AGAM|nr:hypothetical protein M407DRAFT_27887 [Tulasnella calospora MUT 4182]
MPSPIQAAPLPPSWDIQAPRTSQWGAMGVTTTPQPGTLPGGLGSMFASGPAGSQLAPQTPHAPLITSSTPIPKPPCHKSSSAKAKVAPQKPIAQKTVYLVPRNGITQLTAKIKAPCDFASLIASPRLWVDMSSGEVQEALQAPFKHIIDFKEHSYQLFHVTCDLGPTLCPAPSDFPDSTKLHDLYQKRDVLVMWLMYDAKVPNYIEGICLYEKTRKKQGGMMRGSPREWWSPKSLKKQKKSFKCLAHCKRRLFANKSMHTCHQSFPMIPSPERKRLHRSCEASSDGKADALGAVGWQQGKVMEMLDLDGEEQAKIHTDLDADKEGLEVVRVDTLRRAVSSGFVWRYQLHPVVTTPK